METLAQDARKGLVEQLRRQGIHDSAVLHAVGAVERHRMLPSALEAQAYENRPLDIGHAQTISQPYIVALMTQLLNVRPGERVLEVGTGSGYQAAVLAELGLQVYSLEIVQALAQQARHTLARLGYADRVHTAHGDGYDGWPAHAPFAGILLTAAPHRVPAPLLEQLAMGRKLVAPVGGLLQELVVLTRTPEGIVRNTAVPVRFVPMTGRAQQGP